MTAACEEQNVKQFLFELYELEHLEDELKAVRTYYEEHHCRSMLAHIYYGWDDFSGIARMQAILKEALPGVQIVGITSSGEIYKGHLTDQGIILSVLVFQSSEVAVSMVDCPADEEYHVGLKLRDFVMSQNGPTAAEILATVKVSMDMYRFLESFDTIDPSIAVFGAGADTHEENAHCCIFTGDQVSSRGIACVTYSGKELHVYTDYSLGWRPLGKNMKITRAEGSIIRKLDGEPAFSIYKRYLNIENDENFYQNALEFPLMYEESGYPITRVPIRCLADGSVQVGSNVEEGLIMHLGYGDPTGILAEVQKKQEEMKRFAPEAIFLYSCNARKSFWKYYVNKELEPFEKIRETVGFYTSGEFIRLNHKIICQNATLLGIGMREGEPATIEEAEPVRQEDPLHGQLSILQRLVTFLQETTKELEDANAKLEELASTDALTGLHNRGHIQQEIHRQVAACEKKGIPCSTLMLDIDHFKAVNDTYGHAIGDFVLQKVSAHIKAGLDTSAQAGRWGGEEFVVVTQSDVNTAAAMAEVIRSDIAACNFAPAGQVTVSIGVAQAYPGEESTDLYKRVDDALYQAKQTGRNRIVIAK